MRKFSGIDHLKRDRKLEGETGVDLKIDADIFFTVRAASDANAAWKDKAPKVLREIKRLTNAGAPDDVVRQKFAALYSEALVIGWHGGQGADGKNKPGGPLDENGDPVPFSPSACADFLMQADDAIKAIDDYCFETQTFREARKAEVIDQGGKSSHGI